MVNIHCIVHGDHKRVRLRLNDFRHNYGEHGQSSPLPSACSVKTAHKHDKLIEDLCSLANIRELLVL